MGGGSSTKKQEGELVVDANSLQKMLELQLSTQAKSIKYPPFSEIEIQRLLKKFKGLDESVRGSVTLEEFKHFPEIKLHFFRDRIYELLEMEFEEQGNQSMNFEYFVKFLTPFHPLENIDIKYRFLFKIYDKNNDKVITQDDLAKVFKQAYIDSSNSFRTPSEVRQFQTEFMNEKFVEKLAKDIMNIVDKDSRGSIDFATFRSVVSESDIYFRMNIVF